MENLKSYKDILEGVIDQLKFLKDHPFVLPSLTDRVKRRSLDINTISSPIWGKLSNNNIWSSCGRVSEKMNKDFALINKENMDSLLQKTPNEIFTGEFIKNMSLKNSFMGETKLNEDISSVTFSVPVNQTKKVKMNTTSIPSTTTSTSAPRSRDLTSLNESLSVTTLSPVMMVTPFVWVQKYSGGRWRRKIGKKVVKAKH